MNKRTLITGVILIAVLSGIIFLLRSGRLPTGEIKPEAGVKIRGPLNAPVKIVEFSDFQCPACMKAEPMITALFEKYPGKINLTFYHFPLPMHRWAGVAHQMSECVNRQGKFWEYHDRVYKLQPIWSASPSPVDLLISYAKETGADMNQFTACLSDAAVTRKVLDERAKGQSLQVNSTPTLFINGERVVGPVELEKRGEEIVRKVLGLPPLPPKPAAPEVPSFPPASEVSQSLKT